MQYANRVSFRVSGRAALFSDPLTRVGGEKCSYQVPTYQALKGVLESVYWKPTFVWVIDRVRVLNRIESQARGIRPIEYGGGNTLSIYTYLKNVSYQVEAHFIWNEQRPDLAPDRNENKHFSIARRMIEHGGRRDVFLGVRECQAYVEPDTFQAGAGYYDDSGQIPFGLMYHGITYPDETPDGMMQVRFWHPKMENGVIEFCAPEQCPVVRPIRSGTVKPFVLDETMTGCDALFEEATP